MAAAGAETRFVDIMSSTLTLYHVLSIIYYIILFLPYLVGFFVNMVFFEPLRKILIILIILCHSDTAFMNGCYFQGNTLIRPEELLPLDSARNPRTNQGKPGLPV